jgi:predicted ATP-grasp superfamily ATP-dependent carboligase
MTELLSFSAHPKMRKPTLVIGWEQDTALIGARATEYLLQNVPQMHSFCDIDPVEFFPLGGVGIENDIVQFPQSTFYASAEHNLIVFRSAIPRYEWHKFLNLVLDAAQEYKIKEIYGIGGMFTMAPHTLPRESWATFSSPQLKKTLNSYRLSRDMDFETPPGSRPTLNSYLLWLAKNRNIPAANLWVPVPFYLLGSTDPASTKTVLEFLNKRMELNLDFTGIDTAIKKQNEKLAQLRASSGDIDGIIAKLESNQPLDDEEHENLVKAVDNCLRRRSI